jgi:hypothetical protein
MQGDPQGRKPSIDRAKLLVFMMPGVDDDVWQCWMIETDPANLTALSPFSERRRH